MCRLSYLPLRFPHALYYPLHYHIDLHRQYPKKIRHFRHSGEDLGGGDEPTTTIIIMFYYKYES